MSLYLTFTPHSWYKGAAIKKTMVKRLSLYPAKAHYTAYLEDGLYSYSVIEFEADTLAKLKAKITAYHTALAERDALNRQLLGE